MDCGYCSLLPLNNCYPACPCPPSPKHSNAFCPQPTALGWLTGLHRDRLADGSYPLLEQHLPLDLEVLQSARALVCLDDDNHHSTTTTQTYDTLLARQFWHGNLPHSANRWHDKSSQFVVSLSTANVAYVGEHSLSDGLPAMELCDFLLKQVQQPKCVEQALLERPPTKWRRLFEDEWKALPETVQQQLIEHVDAAADDVSQRIQAMDLYTLHITTDFGKDWIKQ